MKKIKKLTICSTLILLSVSTTSFSLNKTPPPKEVIETTETVTSNQKEVLSYSILPSPTPQLTVSSNDILPDLEEEEKELVILTFDDGPSKYTVELLDLLDEYDVKATFFVLKYNCVKYPDSLVEITDRGHEIAIHGATHTSFKKLTNDEIDEEITSTIEYIESVGATPSNLVRPPYGSVNKRIKESINYPLINWNIDTEDWKTHDEEEIKDEIESNIEEGSIILMHDTKAVYKCNTAALKDLLPELVEEYHFVTISEYCALKDINLENGKVYRKIK